MLHFRSREVWYHHVTFARFRPHMHASCRFRAAGANVFARVSLAGISGAEDVGICAKVRPYDPFGLPCHVTSCFGEGADDMRLLDGWGLLHALQLLQHVRPGLPNFCCTIFLGCFACFVLLCFVFFMLLIFKLLSLPPSLRRGDA